MTWTKQRLNNLFFFLGCVAVVVMLFTFDVSFVELWQHITHAGYWLIPIVGIWVVVYALNALAWRAIILGNVGKDPDVKYYDADQAVAVFPLATTERGYTLPNGTQVPDRTDWHNIVLYRGLAKVAEKYVHKGDKLYIEGRIKYRSYDDQKGQKRYVTEIYGENMELLSPKPQDNNEK